MLVDTVDSTDRATGRARRRSIFVRQKNFRVVHVFVFNARGELLVQKLASTRERNPNKWGSSVAGYVFAGESYLRAAKRRYEQELGERPQRLRRVMKTSMDDHGCRKFITLYTARAADSYPRFDTSHIALIEYRTIADLLSSRLPITPTLKLLLHEFIALTTARFLWSLK